MAGILGEALGVAFRRHGKADIVAAEPIAKEVIGKLTESFSGILPDDEAWRMHVEVQPEPEMQRPVFTLDDLRNVAGWTSGMNVKLMTNLVAETTQELRASPNRDAPLEISQMIPDTDYATVSRQKLREALAASLPREW